MSLARTMALTPELVALCHRVVADAGPPPGIVQMRDEDFRPAAEDLASQLRGEPLWLFAYGSLLWKPEVPHSEMRHAIVRGWHRAFNMRIVRFRGTLKQPGYMMCLERGGQCVGAVLRIAGDDVVQAIEKLLRREISRKVGMTAVRWLDAETDLGMVKALAFYAGPDQLDSYVANRPAGEIAHGLARACGHWGSGADYLYNTVSHLEQLGIHDEGLWHLQELVAAEIRSLYGV
jgi:glutathione-specific gamma-glutamylcyclotransferase